MSTNNNIQISWDNEQDNALLGSLFADGLSEINFTSNQKNNESFKWQFLKKSSLEIENDFNVPFPYKSQNLTLIQEDNCPCEIKPDDVKEINVYYDKNDKEGLQPTEDKYLFKIKIYSSKDGTKIEKAYYECKVNEDEALFFIEDNTGDISSARIYAKFGEKVEKQILLNLDSKGIFYQTILKIPGIDKNIIKELIDNGVYKAEKSIVKIFAIGLYKFLSVLGIPAKAIGWLCEKIGTAIIEYLSLPDSIWDSNSEEYFLKKENVINSLTIDTSRLKNLRESLSNDNSYNNFLKLFANVFSSLAELMLKSVEIIINSYNNYVIESVNGIYEKYEVSVFVADIQYQLSEKIALFAGLWNGLIDFIGGILIFIGEIAQIQYNVGKDLENFLEQFDTFLSSIINFDWPSLPEIIDEQYEEIKKYFKNSNQTDFNYDKIAYCTGFAVAFIGTMLIPFAAFTKPITIINKLKKATVPTELLEKVSQATVKTGEVVINESKKALEKGFELLELITNFFSKGVAGVREFLKDIWKKIVEWFELNLKKFEKAYDNTLLEGWKVLSKYFKTEKIVKATNGAEILCFSFRKALVPVDKILMYARGKARGVEDLVKLKEELKELKKLRQKQRKVFDENPLNEVRTKKLQKEIDNIIKSLNNKAGLEKIGILDNEIGNKKMFDFVLAFINKNSRKIEPRVEYFEKILGPKGKATVYMTFSKLPDGKLYLNTIHIF